MSTVGISVFVGRGSTGSGPTPAENGSFADSPTQAARPAAATQTQASDPNLMDISVDGLTFHGRSQTAFPAPDWHPAERDSAGSARTASS
jgi:hypothetical protein